MPFEMHFLHFQSITLDATKVTSLKMQFTAGNSVLKEKSFKPGEFDGQN